MKTFRSFIIKEGKHILRDKRTMLILFGMPVVMMILFGFAISTDVKNVRTVIVTSSMDNVTNEIVQAMDASEYFIVTSCVPASNEAISLIRDQKADIAIVFGQNFADNRYNGNARVQVITDAADPNMSQLYTQYANAIIMQTINRNGKEMPIVTKLLYNPQMKSSYSFVPGIMGMLLLLICTMMTSISIVREKERGTMEVLLVSPIKPIVIIIAKAVPYILLSLCILVAILLMSRYVLDVPLEGSLANIFLLSIIYILLALSLGLLLSTVATTQLTALLVSAMAMILPSILLSGMIYPIESMPDILQYLTIIVPTRYYISGMRKLMIMGVGMGNVVMEISVLSGMTVTLLTIALMKFKKRLE